MGASFGLMELAMGGTGGEWTTAYLYDQGLGPVVEVVEHGPGGSGPRAGHDIGRGKVEDLRVVHSEAGHYILWSDSALRLFH